MTIFDLLVIYFSFGAPAAVYVYLQNRARFERARLLRQTAFTFLFWIPVVLRFAISLKRPNVTSPSQQSAENLRRLQKRFEKILLAGEPRRSVFEFRETLERYAGLTLAVQESATAENEEFFLTAQNKNPALAARCYDRRKKQLLHFHQISARRDFLNSLAALRAGASVNNEVAALAREFVETLNDRAAEILLNELFEVSPRVARQPTRKIAEDEKQFLSIVRAPQI